MKKPVEPQISLPTIANEEQQAIVLIANDTSSNILITWPGPRRITGFYFFSIIAPSTDILFHGITRIGMVFINRTLRVQNSSGIAHM